MKLTHLIESNRDLILANLNLGRVNWDDLVGRLGQAESKKDGNFNDEQVWTFLACCAYAMSGSHGIKAMSLLLTEGEIQSDKLWIEVLPYPPREQERNTNLDLAFGSIDKRRDKKSGIKLKHANKSTVCFCEFKWLSDISLGTKHDPHRNQLSRVIENAIMFSDENGHLVNEPHVTLVTPGVFRNRSQYSRLYQYKWQEYRDILNIAADLDESRFPLRAGVPKPIERVSDLRLHWMTYEELIAAPPDFIVNEEHQEFFNRVSALLLQQRHLSS